MSSAPWVRDNLIAAGFGPIRSGKSELLHQLFVRQFPRVLSIDLNAETWDRNPNAIGTYGLADTLMAIKWAAGRPGARWHLAAALEDADVAPLLRLLAPPITAPNQVSIPRALGGLLVECGELYFLAPNEKGDKQRAAVEAFNRSRHHLLSFAVASQRGADCARVTTQAAHVRFFLQTDEPRDLDFVGKLISEPIAAAVRELPRYHALIQFAKTGEIVVCDDKRRIYKRLTRAGAVVR
jgi:hypothetical protein